MISKIGKSNLISSAHHKLLNTKKENTESNEHELIRYLKIELERSGGILGSTSSHTIDTSHLTKSQAFELEKLLKKSDFFKLSSVKLANPKGAADYYTYIITVEDGVNKHTVKCTDLAMSKNLQELINALSKLKS